MRREVLCLSNGSFAVALRYRISSVKLSFGSFAPQRKCTMDNLDVALHRLELFEVPLEGFEILQECRLSARTGHGGHKFIRKVR